MPVVLARLAADALDPLGFRGGDRQSAGARAAQAGAQPRGPPRQARSRAASGSPAASSAGSLSRRPSATRSISERMWSPLASSSVTSVSSATSVPPRTASRTLSTAWVKATTWSSPNRPAEPLMVWAARKMALTVSGSSSGVQCSIDSSADSMSSSSSRLSATKV